jgi:DNA-directed RNA polymerase subunit alpha
MRRFLIKDIIKPKKVDVQSKKDAIYYGKVVVEPLERGYGTTLGVALRRILLSSLHGAAITSVKIEGVMHEFSTVQGMYEDVTRLILNLKEIVFKMEDKEEAKVRLSVKGPAEIRADSFICEAGVSVVNTGASVATLSEGATLEMECTVKLGRGYATSEQNNVEGAPIGTIFIDSKFSPVRSVNMIVMNARVGQRTDYDKLELEIWTDGSIDPRSALNQAAHILVDQFNVFVGDSVVIERAEVIPDEPKQTLNENLFKRIEEIELSVRRGASTKVRRTDATNQKFW